MPALCDHADEVQRALWLRIAAHDFEPDTPLNFTRRLARDRSWSLPEARAAIDAYRCFSFLAMVAGRPVTPSEAVDEVWHQHLTYSRDYWDRWCGTVLRAPLHHDPTPGGAEAQAGYRRAYAETLALHERFFGPPSALLWPGTHERFARLPRFRTIDTRRCVTVPRLMPLLRRRLEREA